MQGVIQNSVEAESGINIKKYPLSLLSYEIIAYMIITSSRRKRLKTFLLELSLIVTLLVLLQLSFAHELTGRIAFLPSHQDQASGLQPTIANALPGESARASFFVVVQHDMRQLYDPLFS